MDDSDNDANLQTREDSIDEDDAFSSLPPGSIKPSESSSTKKRKRSCGTKVNMLFACYHHTMLPSCKYCLLRYIAWSTLGGARTEAAVLKKMRELLRSMPGTILIM
jgi:hypothetical protein